MYGVLDFLVILVEYRVVDFLVILVEYCASALEEEDCKANE